MKTRARPREIYLASYRFSVTITADPSNDPLIVGGLRSVPPHGLELAFPSVVGQPVMGYLPELLRDDLYIHQYLSGMERYRTWRVTFASWSLHPLNANCGEATAALENLYLEGVKYSLVEPDAAATKMRLVHGVVLAPDVVDYMGESYSAAAIQEAAHQYLRSGRANGVVESYVAPCDLTIEDTPIAKGTWVIAAMVPEESLDKLVSGGISVGGIGRAIARPVADPLGAAQAGFDEKV